MRLVSYIVLEHLFLSILFNSFMKLFHADKLVFSPSSPSEEKLSRHILWKIFKKDCLEKHFFVCCFQKEKNSWNKYFFYFSCQTF